MTKITCDKCKKEFKFKPRIEKKNGIERVYIKCPKCKTEYTAFYTDNDIRFKQHTMRVMQMNNAQEKDTQKKQAMFDVIQELKHEIGQDMEKLKRKYEG